MTFLIEFRKRERVENLIFHNFSCIYMRNIEKPFECEFGFALLLFCRNAADIGESSSERRECKAYEDGME